MGLFLDQIRDKRKLPEDLPNSYRKFEARIKKGIAFLTFDFGIDGVSVEISKYTDAFESIIDLDPKKNYTRFTGLLVTLTKAINQSLMIGVSVLY